MPNKIRVIGVGLHKTGTTTLARCLSILGYRHVSFDPIAFDYWAEGKLSAALDRFENFESCTDWPWPLLYPQLDERFAETKFILTTRETENLWLESLIRHAQSGAPTKFRKRVYGYECPSENPKAHLEFYRRHNEEVRKYFQNSDRFADFCWEHGDAWGELCRFLGHPIPNRNFPHQYKSR